MKINIYAMLLFILSTIVILVASQANAGIDEGLILHWSFDDCTMTDLTENGYDGTIHGDITCISGIKNSAITFSAESEAYATLAKTLDPNETKAFSFWINSIGFHDKDDYSVIISKYNWYGDRSFWLDSADNDNQISRISVVFYHNGASYDGDYLNSYYPETPDDETVEVIINEPLEFGIWNHVVVNVLDTEIQMWINGKMVTRKERVYDSYYNSSEPTQVANEFLIGPDFNYKYYLNGSLDEFRVYNRALSESEIEELYNEGEGEDCFTQADIEGFVTRFYQECLDREPDTDGLNSWIDALNSGNMSGSDLAWSFIYSDEFQNKNTPDDDYLEVLYQAFFNRESDQDGYNNWLSLLAEGTDRSTVLEGFISSQEFITLCEKYGITAVTVVPQFETCAYAGSYSGTFSGDDHGTWSATVSDNCEISGSGYSYQDGFFITLGNVTDSGSITMVAGDATTGATFSGNFDSFSGGSGTWFNSYYQMNGTFSGNK